MESDTSLDVFSFQCDAVLNVLVKLFEDDLNQGVESCYCSLVDFNVVCFVDYLQQVLQTNQSSHCYICQQVVLADNSLKCLEDWVQNGFVES